MIDQDGNYVDPSAYQHGGDGQYATVDTSSTGEDYQSAAETERIGSDGAAWWSDILSGLPEDLTNSISMAMYGGGPIGSERGAQYNAPAQGPADQGPAEEGMLAKFQRIGNEALTGMKDGTAKAWKDNPLELLKLGAGAVGNAYLAEEKRKAAETLAQSGINRDNNEAAIAKAKVDAYNASFSGMKKRTPIKQTPLTRIDGTAVYTNGKLNRG